jgi:outer membrane beta-barrel protein
MSYMKNLSFLFLILMTASLAQAEEKSKAPETGEELDVTKVTEKYWAQGQESELGVVQNRKFTSHRKFELDLLSGTISTDPFLSVASYGGSLGYHFSPYFSVHAIAWKASVSDSDAYKSLIATTTNRVGRNAPKAFYGLQVDQDILYGKASLFGKAIIYVDIFALAGIGITSTDTGKNTTPFFGIGQKIHLNQHLALHLDYRIMRFNETIPAASGGAAAHERTNTTDAITLGIGFLY